MGTSIEKLDRYYMSKPQVVTQAMAAEWFNIYPEPTGQILLLHPQNENGTPFPCANAKGVLSYA